MAAPANICGQDPDVAGVHGQETPGLPWMAVLALVLATPPSPAAGIPREMAAVSGKLRLSGRPAGPRRRSFGETAAIPREMAAVSGKLRSRTGPGPRLSHCFGETAVRNLARLVP